MRYKFLFISYIILNSISSWAQIGIPQIKTFSSLTYKGGTQNWQIDQDKSGIIYFANNEGLLTYDGKHWKLYPLPNRTIVRSVKVNADGKIYVGGQDEIGYFFPDDKGILRYNSLKEFIPKLDRQLEDVWDIVINKNEIYFRTNSKILQLKDGTFNIYKSKGLWEFLCVQNNEVYAQDLDQGLLKCKNNSWETVITKGELNEVSITSMLPYNDNSLLITTNKNGLYILKDNQIIKKNGGDDDFFKTNRIYDAIRINNDWYAFATVSSGCVIVNKDGKIIQKFTSKEGLQKDNLRCVFKDKNQNLWLGLDDGIDFIAFNNAIRYIYPDKEKQTSSYTSQILNNVLYVGTSNGVFASKLQSPLSDLSFNDNDFTEIPNTKGQVWNFNIINNQLLVGNEDGTLVIDNFESKSVYKSLGTWMFQPLSPYFPSTNILAGTYNGLILLNYQNGNYKVAPKIRDVDESLRFIVYDFNTNDLWASHPYRGIYRFKLENNKQQVQKKWLYTSKNGLPSSLGNYVARIKNRIVVATIKGIYSFDENNQNFKVDETFKPIFGDMMIQYLKEDLYGNIWFVSNKQIGVVDFNRKQDGKAFDIIYFPELNSQVVAGFENIYPYNQQNVFIGANKGLIHINYQNYLKNIKPLTVNLTSVKIISEKDSTLFGGYFLNDKKISVQQDKNQTVTLPYLYNSLHFEYSSTLFEQQNSIEFSYQLEGYDNDWSAWDSKSDKDYTNLPHGKYTFKVKSRNNLGNESTPVLYRFIIAPAWYQTLFFYFLCFFILCFFIYLLILRQKKIHEKEQDYLRKEHLLEIEHNEKEIVKLRNENLEAEVNFKNKELATTTMHLMQRGKLLSKIKEELAPIVNTESIEDTPEEFKKILSLINDAERADSDWDQFAVHFDHVHSNFLTKLKEKMPVLSANDLKLCAYLKMNLSSKEIAQLMSVSIRAVEVSRYRLRKKLEVSSDTNLFDYLIEITNE